MTSIYAFVVQLEEHRTFNAGVASSNLVKRTNAIKIRSGINKIYCKERNLQMTIISEKTGKTYETVEDCLADEKKFDLAVEEKENKKKELANARKERAKEVEDAYNARLEADRLYREKLNKFIDDYGSFHMTINTEVEDPHSIFDFLDNFWF